LQREVTWRRTMEIVVLTGVLAAWLILQAWVLPRFGVKT
jgi:type IV secretory pathway TrbD component